MDSLTCSTFPNRKWQYIFLQWLFLSIPTQGHMNSLTTLEVNGLYHPLQVMCGDACFTDILGFLASRKPGITSVGLWLNFHIWFLVLRCGWRDQGYVTSSGPFYMATKGASWIGHWRGRDYSCIRHHIAATVWWFQVRLTITPKESYLHLSVQSRKIKQGGFINYLQCPVASNPGLKDTKKSAFCFQAGQDNYFI